MTNTPPRRHCLQARFVKLRKPTAITVEGFSAPTNSRVGLIVQYADTADMDDGQSLPPFIDDDCAVWRVVRRLPGGRTRWRRVLSSKHATDRRQVARDFISRPNVTKTHETKIHAQDKAKTKEKQHGHAQVQRRDLH